MSAHGGQGSEEQSHLLKVMSALLTDSDLMVASPELCHASLPPVTHQLLQSHFWSEFQVQRSGPRTEIMKVRIHHVKVLTLLLRLPGAIILRRNGSPTSPAPCPNPAAVITLAIKTNPSASQWLLWAV